MNMELRGNHELLRKTVSFLITVIIIIIQANTHTINNKRVEAVWACSVPSAVVTLLHATSSHPPIGSVRVIL